MPQHVWRMWSDQRSLMSIIGSWELAIYGIWVDLSDMNNKSGWVGWIITSWRDWRWLDRMLLEGLPAAASIAQLTPGVPKVKKIWVAERSITMCQTYSFGLKCILMQLHYVLKGSERAWNEGCQIDSSFKNILGRVSQMSSIEKKVSSAPVPSGSWCPAWP